MTTMFRAAHGMATNSPKPQGFVKKESGDVDALAKERVRRAVPNWQQRRVEREISRYRRMMHPRAK